MRFRTTFHALPFLTMPPIGNWGQGTERKKERWNGQKIRYIFHVIPENILTLTVFKICLQAAILETGTCFEKLL